MLLESLIRVEYHNGKFEKKEELKLKENFLCKIATNCKVWLEKRQSFLIMKKYFDLQDISEDMRESLRVCKRLLMFLKINEF